MKPSSAEAVSTIVKTLHRKSWHSTLRQAESLAINSRHDEAIDLTKQVVKESRQKEDAGTQLLACFIITIQMKRRNGDHYPDDSSSFFGEFIDYLKLMIDAYSLCDPEDRAIFESITRKHGLSIQQFQQMPRQST